MQIKRTTSDDKDFIALVALLDTDLCIRDGEEHSFYAQFNKVDTIKHVVVIYENEIPIGCGAIKAYTENIMEVKRMYVKSTYRGRGIATLVLQALETWAKELGNKKTVLETGLKQPEAIALYKKNGYNIISNYGQYVGVENSVCFEKYI